MKKIILEDYEIGPDTCSLFQAKEIDYSTIVIEPTRTLYIRKTPLQLMKAACLDGGADYDGRRKSVIHKTGIKHNVPMPVNPKAEIYCFPTHSAKHEDCVWIFFNHYNKVLAHPKYQTDSIILLNNGDKIHVEASPFRIQRQVERTTLCICLFHS